MKDFSLPKEHRLLNKKDFASLRSKKALKLYFKTFKVIYIESNLGISRIGFAVSKKVGKANVRNLIKRRVREWFRQSHLKDSGVDIFVVIHPKYKLFGKDKFLKELLLELNKICVKF